MTTSGTEVVETDLEQGVDDPAVATRVGLGRGRRRAEPLDQARVKLGRRRVGGVEDPSLRPGATGAMVEQERRAGRAGARDEHGASRGAEDRAEVGDLEEARLALLDPQQVVAEEVSRPASGSTRGKNTELPRSPCRSGYAPVAIDAAFTRVTVGNTEWCFSNRTPSSASRLRRGMSRGIT